LRLPKRAARPAAKQAAPRLEPTEPSDAHDPFGLNARREQKQKQKQKQIRKRERNSQAGARQHARRHDGYEAWDLLDIGSLVQAVVRVSGLPRSESIVLRCCSRSQYKSVTPDHAAYPPGA